MKNYEKPEIVENKEMKMEGVYAASGEVTVAECPKRFNKYNVDWTCAGKCPYAKSVPGWAWINDICTLAR